MRTMKRALPAVAAIVVVAAACGGVENEPNLAGAAERTEARGSSAFALTVVQSLGGRSQTYTCEGAADYAEKRMRLVCGDEGEFLAIGDTYYARGWTSSSVGLPPDRPWVRIPIEDDEDSPHELAPGVLLTKLRAASIETERLGEGDVRGVGTARYRMTVRCEEAALECPGAETAEVEVWIDDDGLVRRAVFDDDGAHVTAEYFDFGIPAEVAEPPADEVADLADPSVGPCAGGGAPISDSRLRQALRRHGFDAARGRGECLSGVAAQVAAASPGAADAGIALCYVYEAAGRDATRAVEEVSGFGITGLRLRNVHCTSYGDGKGNATMSRVRDALDELARELRP